MVQAGCGTERDDAAATPRLLPALAMIEVRRDRDSDGVKTGEETGWDVAEDQANIGAHVCGRRESTEVGNDVRESHGGDSAA